MEQANKSFAQEKKTRDLVSEATRQHMILKEFYRLAKETFDRDMEALLQSRIVDMYGMEAIDETEVKYFEEKTGFKLSDPGNDFLGYLCECLVAYRGVDLYHVIFYARKDKFCFEAIPCASLEEGKVN